MDNYRFYFQKNNTYLGDCLSVVYKVSPKEKKKDNITGDHITIFVKSPKSIGCIGSEVDFKRYFETNLFNPDRPTLLRVASECFLGTFGDSHCDCESQKISSLKAINDFGQGVYIHIPHEAQGRGLFYKAEELSLQVSGLNQQGNYVGCMDVDIASKYILGKDSTLDIRGYRIIKKIISELGLNKYTYRLITSNSNKLKIIKNDLGIDLVGSLDVNQNYTVENVAEVLAKIHNKFFKVSEIDLKRLHNTVITSNNFPMRLKILSKKLEEGMSKGTVYNCSHALLSEIVTKINRS